MYDNHATRMASTYTNMKNNSSTTTSIEREIQFQLNFSSDSNQFLKKNKFVPQMQ